MSILNLVLVSGGLAALEVGHMLLPKFSFRVGILRETNFQMFRFKSVKHIVEVYHIIFKMASGMHSITKSRSQAIQ